MPDKEESLKDEQIRDGLILAGVVAIYDDIRLKAQKLAMDVTAKADGDTEWFSQYNRSQRFAKKVNKDLRPDYVKRDTFIKNRYAEEYRTAYFYAKFVSENTAIRNGYNVKLPRYTKKQFQDALNYPLSKIMNTAQMQTGRSLDIQQLYRTIVSGVEQGLSLPKINRNLDINLGYRDAQGKWIADKTLRKGQQYKTMRILRTEIGRMRSRSATDQWINEQDIVESKLTWLATLDNRTRRQSVIMDGQVSNKEGKFRYPDGTIARQRESGNPRYDINDRCSTISVDPEYPPSTRIQRDPKTGDNKIKPYINADQWVRDNKLKRNIYGEILFT